MICTVRYISVIFLLFFCKINFYCGNKPGSVLRQNAVSGPDPHVIVSVSYIIVVDPDPDWILI
jgi:hypothetical protein